MQSRSYCSKQRTNESFFVRPIGNGLSNVPPSLSSLSFSALNCLLPPHLTAGQKKLQSTRHPLPLSQCHSP